MDELTNRIRAFICPKHYKPYSFLCIEQICQHDQKFLCNECVDLRNIDGLIEIRNLFNFLNEQYQIDQEAIYKFRANLWQQFQRFQALIIELLRQTLCQIETFFNSIIQNGTINRIKEVYFGRELELDDIVPLGLLLRESLCKNPQKQCQFKVEQIDLQEQNYVQLYETLDKYQQVEQVLSQQLIQNQAVIDNDDENQITQEIIEQVDYSNYRYETTQIMKINKVCHRLQFNHNETQILATCKESIMLFDLSYNNQWIHSEQKFSDHQGSVTMAIFNHNSTEIVSCGDNLVIMIWKKVSGLWTIVNVLDTHSSQTNAICFNNDSTLLASVSSDNTCGIHVIIEDVWQLQQKLRCTNGVAVCFNHNSTLLATGGIDAMITIWALNQQGIWIAKQHLLEYTFPISNIAFNSQSTQLLTSSFDQTLKIWQADQQGNWKCDQILLGHTSHILDFDFNSQTNLIVSCSVDKSLNIWKKDQYNQWTCTQTISSHKERANCCILKKDCSMIITGASDNTIMIHTLIKEQVDTNAQFNTPFIDNIQDYDIYAQFNTPQQINNNQEYNNNALYDAPYFNNIQDQCYSLCFNSDETQIVAAIGKSLILFKISQEGELIMSYGPLSLHQDIILDAKFNHNSKLIASCSNDNLIIIWARCNGTWLKRQVLRSREIIKKQGQLMKAIYSICFNHDSSQLASGRQDGRIYIYKIEDNEWIISQVLKQHTNSVYCVHFNQDSTLMASGSGDNTIMLWKQNKRNWQFYSLLGEHTGLVMTLFFNSNSTQLLSGSSDKSIKIWQINAYQQWICRQTLVGHYGAVRTVRLNKLQDMIISSSEDHTTKIWKQINGYNWECVQTLNDHFNIAYCSIVLHDSSMILTGSADNTILVYKRKKQQ